MIETTTDKFDEDVLASSSTEPIVVDFWAPWCGPCRMVSPLLQEIGEETGLKMFSLNIDEHPSIASQYQIMSIPSIMVFKGGEEIGTVVGMRPKKELTDSIVGLTT